MKKLFILFVAIVFLSGCSLSQPTVNSNQPSTNTNSPIINKPVACTEEAKLCPDGSAVGRTGPNCEFAPCPGETSVIGAQCVANNGKWLEQYKECENVSQTWCEKSGGVFNECASPCRHDPNATMCILMCVPVCQFK